MRIFGSDRMDGMLQRSACKEDEAIIHPWINKALEKAQKKVEARNFDIRKNLLKFDDVMNDQRKVIFEQRIELMKGDDLSETVADMRHEVVEDLVAKHIPERAYAEQWDVAGLKDGIADLPQSRPAGRRMGGRGRHRRRGHRASASPRPPTRRPPKAPSASDPRSTPMSRSRSCCRRSTICGASIWSISTICVRSSASAAMPSAIR